MWLSQKYTILDVWQGSEYTSRYACISREKQRWNFTKIYSDLHMHRKTIIIN